MGRTHVIIDEELLRRIDAVAGQRGRSRFLEEAAREKLDRADLRDALEATEGILEADDYPEFRDAATTRSTIAARRADDPQ